MSISLKQLTGSKKISRETLNFAENQTITVLTSEQKDHSPRPEPHSGVVPNLMTMTLFPLVFTWPTGRLK